MLKTGLGLLVVGTGLALGTGFVSKSGIAFNSVSKVSAQTGACKSAAAPSKYQHVIVITMENKTYGQVIGNSAAPYETSLKTQCASATSYSAASSPSRPNYIAMVSGGVQGCAGSNSDAPSCQSTVDNVMRQARTAGKTSKVYSEGMTSNCQYASSGKYATKHNPYPYFIGADDKAACSRDNVPLAILHRATL